MLIIAYGVARALMVLFAQLRDVWFTVVAQNAVRQLAKRTFRHLHELSLRFHLERRTGGLNRVIERGTAGVDTIVRMAVLNSIPTAVELVMIAGLVAYYFGWIYVVVVLVTVALYVWFTFWASERRIVIRRDMNESDTEAHAKAVDSLLNYETVKYFGNEELEARRFDSSMARYERAAIRTYTSLGVLNSGQAIIFSIGTVICMLLAARDVTNGALTVGGFVMINAILIQLYVPLNFMGMVYREIKQGLIDIETMFALLHEPAEIIDRPGAKPLRVSKGEIKFENVTFAYDPERPILKQVSFTVPAGNMVAIVGPSGAGKSTISRILFRFYEVTSGRVLIDGQNIEDVTQASLRAAIGMVPQDTVLFNDTIEYNIRYGKPDATPEEVREAARLAQIDAFIMTLPQGYDALVGERGLKLSGGEKQRVAIARTILEGAADPDARRGDLGARQSYRARYPGRARAGRARAHEPRHRASPLNRRACRQHPRARSRRDRRAGQASRASRQRRPLCEPVGAPARGRRGARAACARARRGRAAAVARGRTARGRGARLDIVHHRNSYRTFMDKPHSLLDSILGAFVPVHPDGFKFVAGAALATLILFALAPPLGWLGAIATAYCAYFFRDPPRVTPSRAGLFVSAADGRVTAVGRAVPPRELRLGTEPLGRISVFLSVFDVHLVRAPIAGRIVTSAYTPGAFLNAELDKASEENERHALVIEAPGGEKAGCRADRRIDRPAHRDFRGRGA